MARAANIRISKFSRKKILDTSCRRAAAMGMYTVESLKDGVDYFYQDGEIAIITERGYVLMSVDTAKVIGEELIGICNDIEHLKMMEVGI